ncbi:hypothetical protein EVAR_70934_1, partial [Eumeta japonica]
MEDVKAVTRINEMRNIYLERACRSNKRAERCRSNGPNKYGISAGYVCTCTKRSERVPDYAKAFNLREQELVISCREVTVRS